MREYEVGDLGFPTIFNGSQDNLAKNIAGRCSLYLYSQLPFVEIFILPAFFKKFRINQVAQ